MGETGMEIAQNAIISDGPENRVASHVTLEKMVVMPTWREMLLDLVHSNQFDPWNIDIVEISNKYLAKIKNLETRDLRIPANLILAASILIRLKSDALQLEEEVQQASLETYMDEGDAGPVEIPMLELRTRIPPKRRISLDELIEAMDKVFAEVKEKASAPRKVVIPPAMQIKISKLNMEEKMEELLAAIRENTDTSGMATFSSLVGKKTSEAVIYTLLPLLHLAQNGMVGLYQEKFFGEIFIKISGDKAKGA